MRGDIRVEKVPCTTALIGSYMVHDGERVLSFCVTAQDAELNADALRLYALLDQEECA